MIAALVWAQLEEAKTMSEQERPGCKSDHDGFAVLEVTGMARQLRVPVECSADSRPSLRVRRGVDVRKDLISRETGEVIYTSIH